MHEDNALLRQFADDKSEAAFAALVQRHLPMIYAAACRQMGDTHRAQEISVAAFSLLARKAGSLLDHPSLGGWLYTTVAHLATRTRRTEARRVRREQEAHTMHEANTPDTTAIAEKVFRPLVDELLLTLPERDRLVVLLRFFENRPYAEIGARLGLGENAARMRVHRALERLRGALRRRGVGSTATALATALAAQASATPPAGLATSIVTSAAATATAAGGGLLFLMNTSILKTGIVAAAVAIGAGSLLWQHFENTRLRGELAALKASRSTFAKNPAATAVAAAPTDADFLRLSNQVAALRNAPAATWQERADTLQELMAQLPEMQIPELALATPEDWLDATKTPLQSDADYRRALAQVRTSVLNRFVGELFKGVRSYLQQHPTLPADPAQLESYFTNPIGPEVWAHYKVVPADSIPSLGFSGNSIVTLKSAVDPDYDTLFAIGKDGFGTTSYQSLTIRPVVIAYNAANPGKPPASPADLLPYATTNAQRAAIHAAMTQK